MIAAFVASRLFGPAAAVIAAFLLATTVTQCAGKAVIGRQLESSEAARVAAAGDLAQCRADRSALNGAVDAQSAAVAAYQADGERRLAAAQAAVNAAQATAATAKASAVAILSRRGQGDLCKSAESVLRGGEG